MKIVYLGKVALDALADCGLWDSALPAESWGFSLGSLVVRGLLMRGHEVHVVSAEPEGVCGRYCCHVGGKEQCRLTVTFVQESKKTRWMYLRFFWKEMSGIRSVLKRIKPDVVFAQWTYYNAYAGLTSGYPTLVVAHDSPWRVFRMFRNLQTLIKALYATMFVVPKINHLTAVSPHIVDEFRKFGKLKKIDIPVIPNGVMIGKCALNNVELNQIVSDFKTTNPTVVCVCQAGRLKNSMALFKAWDIIGKRHPNWRLVVFGQGMEKPLFDPRLFDCLLSDKVELRGLRPRDEIDQVLREEADLFVSPTLEESFGMVFVEAMVLGVACIGGENSGAVPWVIGEGGVICDVSNAKVLAEYIEKVMVDAGLRRALSEGGMKRVKEMFDIEHVVDLYERELTKVANER